MNLLQKIEFGKFKEIGDPFITVDLPFSLTNKNIIHLRPEQSNFQSVDKIKKYLNNKQYPQVLIITTNVDASFPNNEYNSLLDNKNVLAVITHNPSIIHKKIFPLPLGPKWQFRSTLPYGESKKSQKYKYLKYCATNPLEAYKLFKNKRKSNIFLRPMTKSVGNTKNYNRNFSKALSVNRVYICNRLCKLKIVEKSEKMMSIDQYLNKLKKYRFVISPHGNGLDSHSTWEALMCGCIPIVPSSPLNKIYKNLPIWVIDDWSEITEKSTIKKEVELLKNIRPNNFSLVFYSGIENYVNSICNSN